MAYRSGSAATTTGRTSVGDHTFVVNAPTGVQQDDIVLLVFSMDASGATVETWPSGFTSLQTQATTADGNFAGIGWRRATASEPSTYTIDFINGSDVPIIAATLAFTGRDTTSAVITGSSVANQNTGQSSVVQINAGTVTAATGDDMVWIGAADTVGANLLTGYGPPTNYTERADVMESTGWCSLGVATRDNVSSGATGTVTGTATLSSGTSGWAAFLVAIKSATASYLPRSMLMGVG